MTFAGYTLVALTIGAAVLTLGSAIYAVVVLTRVWHRRHVSARDAVSLVLPIALAAGTLLLASAFPTS